MVALWVSEMTISSYGVFVSRAFSLGSSRYLLSEEDSKIFILYNDSKVSDG